MRTSERAYHQIRWDRRLAPERFVIGIDVHREVPSRVPLPDFVPGGDIPWHRVLFIELEGERVWDRATGVDRIDALALSGAARPRPMAGGAWRPRSPLIWDGEAWVAEPGRFTERRQGPLRLVSWNVLWDRYESEAIRSADRWPHLIDALLAEAPHLVALQEVDVGFHALLLADPRVRERYWVSHGAGHDDVKRFDLLWMGCVPIDQVAVWTLGPHKAVLGAAIEGAVAMNVHLTSDHSEGAARTRAHQLSVLDEVVARIPGPVVVAGDFNHPDERAPLELTDAWMALFDTPEPTFEPPVNPLARLNSLTGRAARLDRVFLRGLHAHGMRRLGTQPDGDLWLSDHYGLSVTLSERSPDDVHAGASTVRSALCWLPSDTAEIQAVRAEHDPSFVRWPPHVNVLWGFVDESELDAATPILEAAVREVGPFETTLTDTHTFRHTRTASHGLVPSDPAPWVALHRRLRRAFPRCGRADLVPHLTFARTDPDGAPPAAPPVRGQVTGLAVLTRRADEPFVVRAHLDLDGPLRIEPEAVWPPGDPEPLGTLASLPGAVLVGSRQLGCAIEGSDVDLVWPDTPPDQVRELLEPHVDHVEAVVKSGIPGFRAWRGSLVIDATPAHEDPRARSSIDDGRALLEALGDELEAFRGLCRTVKAWARAQALDDPAWGGLEGLAWAVLCARTVLDSPADADLVRAFFTRWAAHDWRVPVALEGTPDEGTFGILTPTEPVRNIAERVQLDRFERSLLEAWDALEHGAEARDLWRPLPFHRRFPFTLFIEVTSRGAAGRARGRGRALLDRVGGVPCPGRPHRIGIADDDATRIAAAERWASELEGVEVRCLPTHLVPTRSTIHS